MLGHPGVTSLKGVSAGERAQGSLRNGNERVVWRWSFSCFSQRARVDGRAEGPERSPAWESCLVCTEVPTLDRFGNYGEIGKFASACTLVLCSYEIDAIESTLYFREGLERSRGDPTQNTRLVCNGYHRIQCY